MKRYFRDCGIENETAWHPDHPHEWLSSLSVPYEIDHEQLQAIAAGSPTPIVGLDTDSMS